MPDSTNYYSSLSLLQQHTPPHTAAQSDAYDADGVDADLTPRARQPSSLSQFPSGSTISPQHIPQESTVMSRNIPGTATDSAPVAIEVPTLPSLPGRPPAAYISAAAAAGFLIDEAAAAASLASSSSSPSIGSATVRKTSSMLSPRFHNLPSPGFSLEAVALLNAFLDHVLLSILAAAPSSSLSDLRLAAHAVLKARLAAAATLVADEEVRGLVDSEEDEPEQSQSELAHEGGQDHTFKPGTLGTFPNTAIFGGITPPRTWMLQARFRRLRLRIMVYAQLGDVEELDEQQYLADTASDDELLKALGLSDGLAAIFLAGVLEHIAEQALLAVHGTAAARGRGDNSTSVFVEEKDVQKLSLNGTLGRLFRSFRRPGKDIAAGLGASMLSMSGTSVRSLSAMSGGPSSCGSVDEAFPVPPTISGRDGGGVVPNRDDLHFRAVVPTRSFAETRTYQGVPLSLRTDVGSHMLPINTRSAISSHTPLIPLILPSHEVLDDEEVHKQHSRSTSLPLRRLTDKHGWPTPASPRSAAFEQNRVWGSSGRLSAGPRMPVSVSTASDSSSRLVLNESPPRSASAELTPIPTGSQTRMKSPGPGGIEGADLDGDYVSCSETEPVAVSEVVAMSIRRVSVDKTSGDGSDSDKGSGVRSIRIPSSPSVSTHNGIVPMIEQSILEDDSEDEYRLVTPSVAVGLASTSDQAIVSTLSPSNTHPSILQLPRQNSPVAFNHIQASQVLAGSNPSVVNSRRSSHRFSIPSSIATGRDSPVLMPDLDGSGYSSDGDGNDDYDDDDEMTNLSFPEQHARIDIPSEDATVDTKPVESKAPETIQEESGEDDDEVDEMAHVTARRRPVLGFNTINYPSPNPHRGQAPLSPVLERPTTDELTSGEYSPKQGGFPPMSTLQSGSLTALPVDMSSSASRPLWDFDSELRTSDEPKRYKIVSGALTGVSGHLIDAEVESDRLGLLDKNGRDRERARDMTHIAFLSKQAGIKMDGRRNDRGLVSSSSATSIPPQTAESANSGIGPTDEVPVRQVRASSSNLRAREGRAETESMREFADFLRSSGPEEYNMKARMSPSNGGSLAPAPPSSTKAPSIPPITGLSQGNTFSSFSLSPRTAAPSSGANADLIDFLRQGPTTNVVVPSSHASLTSASPSMRLSSINSATPLLDRGIGAGPNVGGGAIPTVDDDRPSRTRQRTINKDPYALPSEDEDEGQDENENEHENQHETQDEQHVTVYEEELEDDFDLAPPPRRPVKKDESMFDFLLSVEPPAPSEAQPFLLSERTRASLAERDINVLDKPGNDKPAKNGTSRGIFGFRSKKSQAALDRQGTASTSSIFKSATGKSPSPVIGSGPTSLRSPTTSSPALGNTNSWPLHSNPPLSEGRVEPGSPAQDSRAGEDMAGSRFGVGLGLANSTGSSSGAGGTIPVPVSVARPKPRQQLRPRSPDAARSSTAELAAFLRESGPPPSPPAASLNRSSSFLSSRTNGTAPGLAPKKSWRRKLVGQ